MPQGLGTPTAPIEAQTDTEAPEAEEETEADTPVQASALAEDRVDTEAARVPIAEKRVPGTALGKGTNKPRATTLAYVHHTSTVAPSSVYKMYFLKRQYIDYKEKELLKWK